MNETELLISKIEDLSVISDKNHYPEFSRFLDMTQQMQVKNIKAASGKYYSFGGYPDAERKIIGCFPAEYEPSGDIFPIKCVKIIPAKAEELTHRDYLGSLMGLGIKRECIGDISINEKWAYCFLTEDISEYVLYNLKSLGRTSATVEIAEEINILPPKLKRISGTVASQRLDCVIAMVEGTSRGKVHQQIAGKLVMVNHIPVTSESMKLKENDVVTVRGFGKFIYRGDSGFTRKGRLKTEIDLYI